MIICSLWTCT